MAISRQEAAGLAVDETGERLAPVHPGEVLIEEFMKPLGLSARALGRELNVPANRITEIINGERSVSAVTALLFAGRFSTSPEFWINLQTAHDLQKARELLGVIAQVRASMILTSS